MTLDQIQMWTDININTLRTKYNITNFVETGVYLGASVQIAYNSGFTSVHSCDINKDHINNARRTFPHANIIEADSITFLKELLPILNGWAKKFQKDKNQKGAELKIFPFFQGLLIL